MEDENPKGKVMFLKEGEFPRNFASREGDILGGEIPGTPDNRIRIQALNLAPRGTNTPHTVFAQSSLHICKLISNNISSFYGF
jgi:hypothetical protein